MVGSRQAVARHLLLSRICVAGGHRQATYASCISLAIAPPSLPALARHFSQSHDLAFAAGGGEGRTERDWPKKKKKEFHRS